MRRHRQVIGRTIAFAARRLAKSARAGVRAPRSSLGQGVLAQFHQIPYAPAPAARQSQKSVFVDLNTVQKPNPRPPRQRPISVSDLAIPQQFSDVLDQLAGLSRNHLLYFRLQVGRHLLDTFFGGDPAAYTSTAKNKEHTFSTFLTTCAAELAEIGLQDRVLRQCISAHLVVLALPAATVQQLGFSQVVELSRVRDVPARLTLAEAAVANHWTSRQIKDAAEAKAAGLTLPEPTTAPTEPESAPVLHQGRVVSRFERAAEDLETLATQWADLSAKALPPVRKERMRKALLALQARTAALLAGLDAAK